MKIFIMLLLIKLIIDTLWDNAKVLLTSLIKWIIKEIKSRSIKKNLRYIIIK